MKTVFNIIKWTLRILLLGSVLVGLLGIIAFYVFRPADPPAVREAPWIIQTFSRDDPQIPSRFYYASKVVVLADGTPQATDWWSYNGSGYERHDGIKLFPKDEYGNVDIKRRKE